MMKKSNKNVIYHLLDILKKTKYQIVKKKSNFKLYFQFSDRQRNEEKKRLANEENIRIESERERKRKAVAVAKVYIQHFTLFTEPSSNHKFSMSIQSEEPNKKCKIDKPTGEPTNSTDISGRSSPAGSVYDQTDMYESGSESIIVDCDSISNSSSQLYGVDDFANQSFRKHPVRRRGRPRGSRTTNRGGLTRAESVNSNVLNSSQESTDPLNDSSSSNKSRRGPGRPRLKPNGAPNHHSHRPQKYRKSIAPLVVPLGISPVATPTIQSPSMSPERI